MTTINIYKPHSKYSKNGLCHGCYTVYKNGCRMLITGKCSKCRFSTNDPFWKKVEDVDFKILTRAQKKKLEIANKKDVFNYFIKTVEKNVYNEYEIQETDNEARLMTIKYAFC